MPDSIQAGFNAARVLDAISRIGYQPWSAINDLIDNSIAAGAKSVVLELRIREGVEYHRANNLELVRIYDDGRGMDEASVANAFSLGSTGEYEANSLSKYGMGLKSAGLSLGSKIAIWSRSQGVDGTTYYLDRQLIEEDYLIYPDPDSSLKQLWLEHFSDNPSGTVVEISNCHAFSQPSARTIVERLRKELGTIYYSFLAREENPLEIVIKCEGLSNGECTVVPFDILFLSDSILWDPDTYDGKRPVLHSRNDIPVSHEIEGQQPTFEIVLFPKADMKKCEDFSAEEKDAIRKYEVGRKNKGFYIYRNGRLIQWGADLEISDRRGEVVQIPNKDLIGFRARLVLTTEHDDYFHVDVSKQRLVIPEHCIEAINNIYLEAKDTHKRLWGICDEILDRNTEGSAISDTLADVEIEDPDEDLEHELAPEEERRRRNRRMEEEDEERKREREVEDAEEESDEEEEFVENEQGEEIFLRVRYSRDVQGNQIYDVHKDAIQGYYIRVDKNHSLVRSVVSKLPEGHHYRLFLEGFLFCLGVGEALAIRNLNEDDQLIRKVINKFKRVASTNLENWIAERPDIFEDERN